jgi:hypothetical protein
MYILPNAFAVWNLFPGCVCPNITPSAYIRPSDMKVSCATAPFGFRNVVA